MSRITATLRRRFSHSIETLREMSAQGSTTSSTSSNSPETIKRHSASSASPSPREPMSPVSRDEKLVIRVRCNVDPSRFDANSIALLKTVLVQASISVEHLIYSVVIPKLNAALAGEAADLSGYSSACELVDLPLASRLYEHPDVIFNNCELFLNLHQGDQLTRGSRVLQRPKKFDSDSNEKLFEALTADFLREQEALRKLDEEEEERQGEDAAERSTDERRNRAVAAEQKSPEIQLILAQLSLIHGEDLTLSMPADQEALAALLAAGKSKLDEVNELTKQPAGTRKAMAEQSMWRNQAALLERVNEAADKRLKAMEAGSFTPLDLQQQQQQQQQSIASSSISSTTAERGSPVPIAVSPARAIPGTGGSLIGAGSRRLKKSRINSPAGSPRPRSSSLLRASPSPIAGRHIFGNNSHVAAMDDDDVSFVPTAPGEEDDLDGKLFHAAQFFNVREYLQPIKLNDPSFESIVFSNE